VLADPELLGGEIRRLAEAAAALHRAEFAAQTATPPLRAAS
jgi:hypothetical protein